MTGLDLLYNDVKTELLNTGVVNWVDVYNSQDVSVDDEYHLRTPAVFVSFKNLRYYTLPYGAQNVEGDMWLRVVQHQYDGQEMSLYRIAQEINTAIHRMKDPSDRYGSLVRTGGSQNENWSHYETFDLWYHFIALEEPVESFTETTITNLRIVFPNLERPVGDITTYLEPIPMII